MGTFLTTWTIRLSLLFFCGTLIGWLLQRDLRLSSQRLMLCWTLAFVLFVLHVLSAFHFHHHWSHSAALLDTARKTRDQLGIEFGGGLYFNYLFLLVWFFDLVWLWRGVNDRQTRWTYLRVLWIGYLVFIAFNSTAVFEVGWTRIGGILGIVFLFMATLTRILKWSPSSHGRNGSG